METGKIERNPDAPEASPLIRSGRDLEREAAGRLDEIRQYFQDLYARRDVLAHTRTPSGQELDWIPAESQVSGELAEPPESEPPDHPAYQIATDFSGTSTWGSNLFWGGSGGVP